MGSGFPCSLALCLSLNGFSPLEDEDFADDLVLIIYVHWAMQETTNCTGTEANQLNNRQMSSTTNFDETIHVWSFLLHAVETWRTKSIESKLKRPRVLQGQV